MRRSSHFRLPLLLSLLSQVPRSAHATSPAASAGPAVVTSVAPVVPAVTVPSSDVVQPNITDPRLRDTQLSAYSLQKGQVALNSTLLGASSNEFFVALGVTYGFGHGLQAGVNVAYLGAGLLNLAAKWTFLEKGPFAASIDVNPMFIHGDWMWMIGFKELFAGIDMGLLPVQLSASYLPLPWLQFDFATRYTGGIVVADVHASHGSLDANINLERGRGFARLHCGSCGD
jgi:hypothetical protein